MGLVGGDDDWGVLVHCMHHFKRHISYSSHCSLSFVQKERMMRSEDKIADLQNVVRYCPTTRPAMGWIRAMSKQPMMFFFLRSLKGMIG